MQLDDRDVCLYTQVLKPITFEHFFVFVQQINLPIKIVSNSLNNNSSKNRFLFAFRSLKKLQFLITAVLIKMKKKWY